MKAWEIVEVELKKKTLYDDQKTLIKNKKHEI